MVSLSSKPLGQSQASCGYKPSTDVLGPQHDTYHPLVVWMLELIHLLLYPCLGGHHLPFLIIVDSV